MGRARYIPGALVEARSGKYGKGLGIIVSGPIMDKKKATGWGNLEKEQAWFSVHWFERPGIVDTWNFNRSPTQSMTKNQIKLKRKRR